MTTTQRLDALAAANHIRRVRVELRRSIAAMSPSDGIDAVADLLDDLPPDLDSMAIGALLGWPRRMGRQHVGMFIGHSAARCGESRPVGALTDRQRAVLADELRTLARRWAEA